MKSINYLFIVLIVVVCYSCKQPPQGWNKWRGANGNNVSEETNWDAGKLDSLHVLWKKNIGYGHSAFIVHNNRCFISGWNQRVEGKDSIGEGSIFCMKIGTGEVIWKFPYPSDKRSFPGPRSTPIIEGDYIYALSSQGRLYCVDVYSGKQKWMVDLIADSLTVEDRWGFCPSPVIYKNSILLNVNKSGLAIDKDNGKVLWNSKVCNAHYSSVKLMKYQNRICGVFMCDSLINIVNPENGKILSSYCKKSDKSMQNDAMITSDNKIFVSDELININDKTLKSIWRNDTISSIFRGGAILGDYAYQFSDNNNKTPLICVDLNTGMPKWSVNLGRFGALTIVGDKLIILTGLGKVIIANASPDKFSVVKELQILPSADIEKNWCWTLPIFYDGKLFVRNSGGDVACIDLGI